jgi:hypothetical protein
MLDKLSRLIVFIAFNIFVTFIIEGEQLDSRERW